ncbi:MAG: peptidyl-prolyl cis-trans isomerase [Planctomycetota bacterium]|nr:peptidyl-prolyl cis-trans isomerase [Planctomycetota bacterium]
MNSESNFSSKTDWQKRIGLGVLTLGVALTAMLVLKKVPQPKVAAETPQLKTEAKQTTSPASLPKSLQTSNIPSTNSDYSSRVVAYVYDNMPVTREELGEYLIARYGTERLDLLCNKKIIDNECRKAGIEVTAAEVENSLSEDLKGLNVDRKTFVDKVLKNYRKNLYEWKEDVIRPKLMLSKLVRSRVKVTDDDIKKAFDAYYGEKVECRIVMYEKGFERAVLSDYPRLRDSEEEFHKAAKNQKSSSLAATAGKIRPIARNTTGNDELEKAAFALQPNEVSPVIGTPEGLIIVKCDKRIPADTTVNLESVREKITAEIIEKKIAAEIPVAFSEMRKRANPKLILQGVNQMDDLTKTIAPLIKEVDDALKAVSGGK